MSLRKVPLDLQIYSIFLLRAGAIHLTCSGFIAPRPAALKEIVDRIASRRETGMQMVWDTFR